MKFRLAIKERAGVGCRGRRNGPYSRQEKAPRSLWPTKTACVRLSGAIITVAGNPAAYNDRSAAGF